MSGERVRHTGPPGDAGGLREKEERADFRSVNRQFIAPWFVSADKFIAHEFRKWFSFASFSPFWFEFNDISEQTIHHYYAIPIAQWKITHMRPKIVLAPVYFWTKITWLTSLWRFPVTLGSKKFSLSGRRILTTFKLWSGIMKVHFS